MKFCGALEKECRRYLTRIPVNGLTLNRNSSA